MPDPAPRQATPLSDALPPLVLGTATFNHQYNSDPLSLPSTAIVHHALRSGIRAFDTSPYYGPAEGLLGQALQSQSDVPRSEYFLSTKCGRVAAEEFDYSPDWIRKSIRRSLERLGTEYLDVAFCHDVEFVTPEEVFGAVRTLRELRDSGLIRYVGISGYPLQVLADLAQRIKTESGESLDAVMSYAHYTLQNTKLHSEGLRKLLDAGVGCVLNGSPLGMGLLRNQGVPVGDLGDFHPAPKGLRDRVHASSKLFEDLDGTERLETLALRFSLEGWTKDGAPAGTAVKPLLTRSGSPRPISFLQPKIGVSVAGVSFLNELEELLVIWGEIIRMHERDFLYRGVMGVLGDDWAGHSWPSPGEDYVYKQPAKAAERRDK